MEIRKETHEPSVWLVYPDGRKIGTAYDVTICDYWVETPFGPFNRGWRMSVARRVVVPAPPPPPRPRSFLRRLFDAK